MPDNPPSHAQLRAYVKRIGGHDGLAARHGISPRAAQRFYSGAKPLPPSLAAEITAAITAAMESGK